MCIRDSKGAYLIQQMNDKLVAHKNYIHEVGQDLPEICLLYTSRCV